MRRVAICAVTLALLLAFAVAWKHPPIARATSSNLTIQAAAPLPGCPLGPAFTFCNQIPQTNSAAANLTVTANVAVSSLSASLAAIPGLSSDFAVGDFTILPASTCTGSLSAGKTCTVSVAFSPTTSGLRAVALTVTDAASDKATINLEGTGANLALAPPAPPVCQPNQDNTFTFCDELPTNSSGPQAFTLTAGTAGASNINVTLAAMPGPSGEFNAADFPIQNGCNNLGGGKSCTIDVEFSPAATSTGLRAAALTATDAANDTATVYLEGHVTSFLMLMPPAAAPACSIGSAFEFCNEPTGGNTAATTFTLKNTSGTTLQGVTVPSASPNSDFKVSTTNCSATLLANSSCTLSVEFTPQQTGLRQDSLSVTDNEGDIGEINFAGTGDDYSLALTAGQPLEITVPAGGTGTFNAQVKPDSVLGLNGEQVTFVCPINLPTNTSCQITPCPATLTAGTPTSFSIKFVTSSATSVAPVPTGGCSGYGPQMSPSALVGLDPGTRWPVAPASIPYRSRPPALWVFAISLGLGILAAFAGLWWVAGSDVQHGRRRQHRRVRLAFACATVAALMIAAGCHHGAAKPTSATSAGTTDMYIQGNALDAQGNPLGASRSLEVMLTVTAH